MGAEGTLGIITEMTLKLHGIPEAVAAGVCRFPSVDGACAAAITAIQAGIQIARVEFLDAMQVRVCNAHSKPEGELTTSFLSICTEVKDNRILPSGFLPLPSRLEIAKALGADEELAVDVGTTGCSPYFSTSRPL